MIAYLVASDRRSVSRSHLASLLWSDRGEQQSRDSLRQTLREIRTSGAAAAVDMSNGEVRLHRFVTSDLERAITLATRNDCAALAQLLPAIAGEYLQDLDGLSPAFDDWLRNERTRTRERLLSAALDCAEDPGRVSAEARHAVLRELERLDPLHEVVVRLLIELDHAHGDIAAVHRRYRRFSDALAHDLNVVPSLETQQLFETLTAQAPAKRDMAASANRVAVSLNGAKATERTPPVVAVLAFEPDGGGEISRLAAIVTESVSASLSQSQEFRVVRSDLVDKEKLSALLDRAIAGFLLRGSVRAVGSQVMVTAELSSAGAGLVIWAERFDLDAADFERAALVVARIVGAVGSGVERHLLDYLPVDASRSYENEASGVYARGKTLAHQARTLAGVQEAAALYEHVIGLDPRHVGARLRLAQLHNTDFHYLMAGHDAAALRTRALALTLEATEIEPATVRVRLRLAWCLLRKSDWEGARAIFFDLENSLSHDADAANECGFGLAQLGELAAARDLIQRAFRLNPFAPAEYHADFAVLQALSGEHALAETHFEICGEQRLFWRVLRMSNLSLLDPAAPHLNALQARFVQTFQEIWKGASAPTFEDVRMWSHTVFCFRRPEHRLLVDEGLSQAWKRFEPAAADNSS